jgi:hypothetical protein
MYPVYTHTHTRFTRRHRRPLSQIGVGGWMGRFGGLGIPIVVRSLSSRPRGVRTGRDGTGSIFVVRVGAMGGRQRYHRRCWCWLLVAGDVSLKGGVS